MTDLSNTELLIPYGTYQDMVKRSNEYKKLEKKDPSVVYLDVNNKTDYITYTRLLDIFERVNKWKKTHPEELKNVWIKKPTTKREEDVFKPTTDKGSNIPVVNIRGKNYSPKNFTEFYQLMGGFGYSYYYNDILTLSQEIQSLTHGRAMNCTDFAQLGTYIASQYTKKEGGKVYQTRYVHINCRSGGGHTTFQIKGGEFGDKWTMVDLAAKANKSSRVYSIGDYWCRDGKIRGYNESWVLKDDGKT